MFTNEKIKSSSKSDNMKLTILFLEEVSSDTQGSPKHFSRNYQELS